MISKETAIQIAKEYAEKSEKGWDEHYHEAEKTNLNGEPVWMISTSDIKYNDALPWMMEHFPNPVYYYVSMVNGICIATGNRSNEFQIINIK
ncbi:hypothetical protein ACCY16_22365 [Candidatus Pantoea formicae]|uniref:hypothetical protein n=1 Tax=Candidatus Pantoea formicae TaxID=2608355 RepID=UPI003EDB52E0